MTTSSLAEQHIEQPPTRRRYGSQWKRKETPMRFTDRDGDILEAIAMNRVLTRDLLLWLFPPDPNAAPDHIETIHGDRRGTSLDRRLTKLYRNGYADRLRLIYGGPFLYALSDRGASYLRAERRSPGLIQKLAGDDFAEKNRTLSTLFLMHTLMIARIRAALIVAGRTAGYQLTRFEDAGPNLTTKIVAGRKVTTLRPDALITLSNEKTNLEFFLEADRSSMHFDKMSKKFRAYEAMHRANQHTEHYGMSDRYRVLIVTKSPARAQTLTELLAGERVHFKDAGAMRRRFAIATETDFLDHPENILADVWTITHRPSERTAIVSQPLPRR